MVRVLAWRILRSGAPMPLREVERAAAHAGLDARDRGLLRRLIATDVRRRATLRVLVEHFARGRIDADLAAHLRLGMIQLLFLDQIPDHAAVSETVEAARETLGERASRIANSVLRKAIAVRASGQSGDPRRDLPLRDVHLTVPVFHDPAEHRLLWAEETLSMPVALVKRWIRRYGEERALLLARLGLEEPPLSLRVTARAEDALSITSELDTLGVPITPGRHPRILLAPAEHAERVLNATLFASGALTVQGESALRAAELCDARPGERWLDLCAAPGGKSAVLAERGARVLALDLDPRRLARAGETFARLGVAAGTTRVAADGAAVLAPESVDGVLLDAPCSNTGVLAQRPEARWRFSSASQQELAVLQARLLAEAAAAVRAGGALVYSTCSIEPEENQRRVRAFLEQHPRFTLEREIEALPAPLAEGGPIDGGYAARLVRGAR